MVDSGWPALCVCGIAGSEDGEGVITFASAAIGEGECVSMLALCLFACSFVVGIPAVDKGLGCTVRVSAWFPPLPRGQDTPLYRDETKRLWRSRGLGRGGVGGWGAVV